MLYLFYDTETTGKWHRDLTIEHDAQPNLVQLAAILADEDHKILEHFAVIVRPDGWTIPMEVAQIHGISDHRARAQGVPVMTALAMFSAFCVTADIVIGHNLAFDINIILRSYWQVNKPERLPKTKVCTMLMAKDVLQLPKPTNIRARPGDLYKWPTLQEAHKFFFNKEFEGAHSALEDTTATMNVYWAMHDRGIDDIAPKIPTQPLSQSPKTGASQRTKEFLLDTINRVSKKGLDDWERQFIGDMEKRLEEYGDRLLVSARQWAVVEKLYVLYLKQEDNKEDNKEDNNEIKNTN